MAYIYIIIRWLSLLLLLLLFCLLLSYNRDIISASYYSSTLCVCVCFVFLQYFEISAVAFFSTNLPAITSYINFLMLAYNITENDHRKKTVKENRAFQSSTTNKRKKNHIKIVLIYIYLYIYTRANAWIYVV